MRTLILKKNRAHWYTLSLTLAVGLLIPLLAACSPNSATPSAELSILDRPTETAAPLPSSTPRPTPTPTALPTPTATPTPSPTPTPTATPTPSPTPTPQPSSIQGIKDALQRASAAYARANTLHFTLEVLSGKAPVTGGDLQSGEGDIRRPGDFQAHVRVKSFLGTIGVEVVGIDQDQYTSNPITGGWIKSSKANFINMAAMLDTNRGVSAVLLNLENPRLIGVENLNGLETRHYQGTTNGQTIAPTTLNILGKYDTFLDIWIGIQDDLVRRIDLKETGGEAAWTINFSRYDQPVTINRPKT